MQRSVRSFIKNRKERKDGSVLLKRTDAQPWKNGTNALLCHGFNKGTASFSLTIICVAQYNNIIIYVELLVRTDIFKLIFMHEVFT